MGAAGFVSCINTMHNTTACDAITARAAHTVEHVGADDFRSEMHNRGALAAANRDSCADDDGLQQHKWPAIGMVVVRLVRHLLVFVPLAFLYVPFRLSGIRAHDLWWKWAIFTLENSGPALVKLGQWAATRSDMFPAQLCQRLSQLHSGARTHSLALSQDSLHEMLSKSEYTLVSIQETPIGSGCIAQVHRAVIAPKAMAGGVCGGGQEVAIKIAHPGVHSAAWADIQVLRFVTRILEIVPPLRYLSLRESVEEFSTLLNTQLDLRNEANNLERFSQNFENNQSVSFPRPIRPLVSSTVLIETLEPGELLSEWLSGARTADLVQKKEVARIGVGAFLDMCFSHNFIHGDLHPGNILVVPPKPVSEGGTGKISLSFLDAGITSELSAVDRSNFVSLFAAIVQGDGRHAGLLMVQGSRSQDCKDPEAFCDGIGNLVDTALGHKLRLENIQAGTILAEAFALACRYRVKIESNFANVCIAIMVLEGVGRQLDPSLDILQAAAPVVLRNLVRNKLSTLTPSAV